MHTSPLSIVLMQQQQQLITNTYHNTNLHHHIQSLCVLHTNSLMRTRTHTSTHTRRRTLKHTLSRHTHKNKHSLAGPIARYLTRTHSMLHVNSSLQCRWNSNTVSVHIDQKPHIVMKITLIISMKFVVTCDVSRVVSRENYACSMADRIEVV